MTEHPIHRRIIKLAVYKWAVANEPVSVTADMNIKVLANFRSQSRRHADALIFTAIHLMY